MQYKLIGNNDSSNIIKTILLNRGISDWQTYLMLNEAPKDTYKNLDYINEAVELFDKHFQNHNPIAILMDNDFDGIASCTLMHNFIKELNPNYDVRLYVHEKNKSHGLDGDFEIDDDVKLFIVPDAGSNNLEEHKELKERGIDIICLDHHQVTIDIEDSPAIIVNNQSSNKYINKGCCGTSITLEFCRALEDYYWESICDKYLDLVATANVCDVMPLTEPETRAIISEGVKEINNKMLQEIVKAQDYSMQGRINPHTIGFYIGPLVNAFIRLATYEERKLLLRAFCEDESETFEYTKRGESFPIEENIYEHCVRLMKSYKGKQDRARDKAFNLLVKKAEKYENDKVVIMNATKELDGPLTGLVAIKLSSEINKPLLLVRDTDEGETLSGSGRAFDNCPIDDFRGLVEANPYIEWGSGHQSAFGCQLLAENLDDARKWFNEQLQDVSMDKIYQVDFVVNIDELSIALIQEIDKYQDLWGHGMSEPLVAVENILLQRKDIHLQGKNQDSIAFTVNDIKFVQFKLKPGDPIYDFMSDWSGNDEDWIELNIVGECSINEYKGMYTPQIMIKDCEVV